MLWVTTFLIIGILVAFVLEKKLDRCPFCHEPRVRPPYGEHADHRDCILCGYCEISNQREDI